MKKHLIVLALVAVAVAGGGFSLFLRKTSGPEAPGAETQTQSAAVVADSSASDNAAIPLAALGPLLDGVDEIEKGVSRETLDPSAIIQTVGRDPQDLLAWTREATRWVPYRGALRGYSGVLMDRMGNSLDRSLLLAQLLTEAGHEIRLANRGLTSAQVTELLDGVVETPFEIPLRSTRPATAEEADYQRYSQRLGVDVEELKKSARRMSERVERMGTEMNARLAAQVPFLAAMIGDSRAAEDWHDKAGIAMQDHWWVQLQIGSDWIDLDPLLSASGASRSLGAPEQTFPYSSSALSVPLESSFVHEVTIRVVIQQSKFGGTTVQTALEQTLRPAELLGQRVMLEVVPTDWPDDWTAFGEDPLTTLGTKALQTTEWLPTLRIGDRTATQWSFTEHGDINPTPGHKNAVGADTSFFGALGGGDSEPANDGQLTAVWVEFEVRVPGESPVFERREISRLARSEDVGENGAEIASDDNRLQRALRLIGTTEILLQNCRLSPEYLVMQDLSALRTNKTALAAFATALESGNIAKAIQEGTKIRPMGSRLLALAAARFAWNPDSRDVYMSEPNVLTYRTSLGLGSTGALVTRAGFDIVTNNVAVHRSPKHRAFVTRVRQGVADTNAEAVLEPVPTVNAGTSLQAAGARPEDWSLIRSVNDRQWMDTAWPDNARSMLQSGFERGYIVILPKSKSSTDENGSNLVWWQVHPRTGETLGMNQFGGGTFSEMGALQFGIGAPAWMVISGACIALRGGSDAGRWDVAGCMCIGVSGGLGIGTAVALGEVGVILLPVFLVNALICAMVF